MRLGELVGQTLGGLLLPELTLLRKACEGIRAALDRMNALEYGPAVQPRPDVPAVEVTYVSDEQQVALMDIELRLTSARGAAPTEDEVVAEYERRYGPERLPQ